MAFASFDAKNGNTPMGEINMVPLIDVMLVLLVIFIVTAPLLTHSVKLSLPRATSTETDHKPPKIDFSIDASGNLFWDDEPVSREEAAARFLKAGQESPQPAIHLRADQETPYRYVIETIVDASKAGLAKVGFISKPEEQEEE